MFKNIVASKTEPASEDNVISEKFVRNRSRRRWGWSALACVAALIVSTALPAQAAVSGPVSTSPATWTPHLPTTTSTTMQIRQLVPCGSMMYAVGRFTTIERGTATYTRRNAFSFNATTGVVSSWNPDVNGVVNSVALSAKCTTVYLGGAFTSVHGTAAKNIVSVNSTTGAVNTGFRHTTSGQVETLLVVGSHLLVGGYFFKGLNGSPRSYMGSVGLGAGIDDNYVHLGIAGNYVYTDAGGKHSVPNATRVYNFELSPDRRRLLVMGVFTRVSAQPRRQMFMLDLGTTAATLNPWYTRDFNRNCGVSHPYFVQAAAWSPDGSTVYVGTTGYSVANGPGYDVRTEPRSGLCDAAAAYSSSSSSEQVHKWVNYTGCDSLFSIAADTNDVYIGGHQRWADNGYACGTAGTGAVSRPGVGSLAPTNGLATSWDPTRARGFGADDMILTSAGLWIASDNFEGSNQCGGVTGLAGICFLPY